MTTPTEDEVRAWLESERRIAERGAAVAREVSMSDRAYERLRVLASSALAMLDEARKDKARLDWLEASGCYVTTSDVDFTPAPLPNLRAAIDQARGA